MADTAKSDVAELVDTPVETEDTNPAAGATIVTPDASKPTLQTLNSPISNQGTSKHHVPALESPPLDFPPGNPRRRRRGSSPARPPARYVREVERCSMQDWTTHRSPSPSGPLPVLRAYYLRKPGSRTNSTLDMNQDAVPWQHKPGMHAIYENKNLQRIIVISSFLEKELLAITSITGVSVGPPYKLYIRYMPDIRLRVRELERQLAQIDQSSTDGEEVEDQYDYEQAQDNNNDNNKGNERKDLEIRHAHLQLLENFLEDELKDIFHLREQHALGTLETIEFEDLWHLFTPGDIAYSIDRGREQLYKVYAVTGGQIQRRGWTQMETDAIDRVKERIHYWIKNPYDQDEEELVDGYFREEGSGIGMWTVFKVDCFMIGFDGTHCGPVEACKKIRRYVGPRNINSLPIYPVKYHPRKDELLARMEMRGRKFLASSGHKSYDGRTIPIKADEARIEVDSDVYIDFDAYYQSDPMLKPKIGKLLRSRQDLREVEDGEMDLNDPLRKLIGHEIDLRLSDDFLAANNNALMNFDPARTDIPQEYYWLMPYSVVGYVFQVRHWYHLDIDSIKDIDRSEAVRNSGFDDLVIDQAHRELLVALVNNHASGLERQRQKNMKAANRKTRTQIDLVRGKGEGLIILLHGPPGSGKTSTAETIAAYTNRPLYSITCGDLGLLPDKVEKELRDHARRADKWGCVLLLDEADVFLIQRDWTDVTRNAMVSVFLRQLEYFSGILFLTTNRPGVIDEAFKSRIHVALRYPSINYESTKQMWINILNRLEQDNKTADVKIQFDREDLLNYARKHFHKHEGEGNTWNGRQIRNAFQTAIALGHYERLAMLREKGINPDEAADKGKKKYMTVKLTKEKFKKIAKTATEFESYIDELRGNDSRNARQEQVRNDEFNLGAPRARKDYSSAHVQRGIPLVGSKSASSKTNTKSGKRKKSARDAQEDSSHDDDDSSDLKRPSDSDEDKDSSDDDD